MIFSYMSIKFKKKSQLFSIIQQIKVTTICLHICWYQNVLISSLNALFGVIQLSKC